jgi:hypothetical protein
VHEWELDWCALLSIEKASSSRGCGGVGNWARQRGDWRTREVAPRCETGQCRWKRPGYFTSGCKWRRVRIAPDSKGDKYATPAQTHLSNFYKMGSFLGTKSASNSYILIYYLICSTLFIGDALTPNLCLIPAVCLKSRLNSLYLH